MVRKNGKTMKDIRDTLRKHQSRYRLDYLPGEQEAKGLKPWENLFSRGFQSGFQQLRKLDGEMWLRSRDTFASETFQRMVLEGDTALHNGGRLLLGGACESARMALVLEGAWRRACNAMEDMELANRLQTVTPGGDWVLFGSPEGLEDSPELAELQMSQVSPGARDIVVLLSSTGETPWTLAAARKAVALGATVFYLLCEPADLLGQHIPEVRELLTLNGVVPFELYSGPQAVVGCTNFQAATMQLLVVGGFLESLLSRRKGLPSADYHRGFYQVIGACNTPEWRKGLSRLATLLCSACHPSFSLEATTMAPLALAEFADLPVTDLFSRLAPDVLSPLGRPPRGMNILLPSSPKSPNLSTSNLRQFLQNQPSPTHFLLPLFLFDEKTNSHGCHFTFDKPDAAASFPWQPLPHSPMELMQLVAVKLIIDSVILALLARNSYLPQNHLFPRKQRSFLACDRLARTLSVLDHLSYTDALLSL
ncbi:MAG: hypothetical protein IJJ26_13130 [Victivallales bacterium]|nr:hypothetical protein [Victivallales bacterium]